MDGFEFRKGAWQNVEWLVEQTEKFYTEHVTPKGLGDRFSVSVEKIVAERGWAPSLHLIEANLEPVARELGIFYVPKQMDPGPCIVFPQRDLTNRYTHGKLKPFYDLVLRDNKVKYANLGKLDSIRGPNFFGVTDRTMIAMGKTRKAIFVEGFFDLYASRLLVPDAPIVSTGTKSIVESHVFYLQMLGVEEIILMFDNEPPKDETFKEGAGNQAMRYLSSKLSASTGMAFSTLLSPADDASQCLKFYESAIALKNRIQSGIDQL